MSEYAQIRNLADIANAGLPDWHPCQRGNAACCDERNVPVSRGDQQVIADAIASGTIAPETVTRAKERAADPAVQQCPFLGPNRECTIYESRPVVCRVTGTAGLPLPEDIDVLQKQADAYYATGQEQGYPVAKTESSMCNNCHASLAQNGAQFPTSSMLIMQGVSAHYREPGAKPMVEFVAGLSTSRGEQQTRRKPSPPKRRKHGRKN